MSSLPTSHESLCWLGRLVELTWISEQLSLEMLSTYPDLSKTNTQAMGTRAIIGQRICMEYQFIYLFLPAEMKFARKFIIHLTVVFDSTLTTR